MLLLCYDNDMKKNQKGFGVIELLILVVLVGLLGFLGWRFYEARQKTDESPKIESTSQVSVKDTTPQGWVKYKNNDLGISFSYPKQWKLVDCASIEHKFIYLGSDNRGVGISGDGKSILCGGGTDFPPQVSIAVKAENDYVGKATPTLLTVDGHSAKKYVDVLDGAGLYPEGFEWTAYYIYMDGGVLEARYAKWPQGDEYYDTSEESKNEFTKLIEQTLSFH